MEAPQHTLRAWLWRINIVVSLSAPLLLLLLQVVEVKGNFTDTNALMTLKYMSMTDPNNCFNGWDPTQADPCTWSRVTCNSMDRVVRVDVSDCGLSGQLPPGLAELDQVQFVNLNMNNIGGSIPIQYGHKFQKLKVLDLYSNKLVGVIPASLANLPWIEYLLLEENQLDGYIPSDLGKIPTLKVLNVSSNNLCGDVPSEITRIPTVDWSNNPGLGKPCP